VLQSESTEGPQILLGRPQPQYARPGSVHETFPPEKARNLLNRLEIHHTPKHGSWLNIAEIEPGALTRQCLSRRIPTREALRVETATRNRNRNQAQKSVDW